MLTFSERYCLSLGPDLVQFRVLAFEHQLGFLSGELDYFGEGSRKLQSRLANHRSVRQSQSERSRVVSHPPVIQIYLDFAATFLELTKLDTPWSEWLVVTNLNKLSQSLDEFVRSAASHFHNLVDLRLLKAYSRLDIVASYKTDFTFVFVLRYLVVSVWLPSFDGTIDFNFWLNFR